MDKILFLFLLSVRVVFGHVHMCWYVSSAEKRENLAFNVFDLDVSLCSHIIYSYSVIDPDTLNISFLPDEDAQFTEIIKMKETNSELKVFLSIGGWTVKSYGFDVVTNPNNTYVIDLFCLKLVKFLRSYNFDGVVIDFEFPNLKYQDSQPYTKSGYTLFLKELRSLFDEEATAYGKVPLVLAAAVAARVDWINECYEASNIVNYLDYILLLSYDLRNFTEKKTRITSALYQEEGEKDFEATLNQYSAVEKWLSEGARPDQIVLGIPAYGRTFELLIPAHNTVGAPTIGHGAPGNITQEMGVLAYFEICQILKQNSSSHFWQSENMNPYIVYNEKYWVGYEDPISLSVKMAFIKENNLSGAFLWSVDLDDFSGEWCEQGKFPLLTAIKNFLNPSTSSSYNSSNMINIYFSNIFIYFFLLFNYIFLI